MDKIKILFVCMGNICRSPTAHGVFRGLVRARDMEQRFEIDCAGTHAYHIGHAPDARAQAAVRTRGIDIGHLRARKVSAEDFAYFDHVLAMDEDNYDNLMALCPQPHAHKVKLFMEFAPDLHVREVPDPYYGGASGFDRVLDLVEAASEGLFDHLQDGDKVKRRQRRG
ncbi:MAG TPA: low molecular weight protein-tyrosine-phosphatase [Gammaproteobacteria bacterium]|nr:low molecular weight protein-tyrosine-phosphatase [Gammaproteobacteria bacterium]